MHDVVTEMIMSVQKLFFHLLDVHYSNVLFTNCPFIKTAKNCVYCSV